MVLPIQLKKLIESYWPPNQIVIKLLQSNLNGAEKRAIINMITSLTTSQSSFNIVKLISWQFVQKILNMLDLTITLAINVNTWLIESGANRRLILVIYGSSYSYSKVIDIYSCQLVSICLKLATNVLLKQNQVVNLPLDLANLISSYLPQYHVLIWLISTLPKLSSLKPIVKILKIDNVKYGQRELFESLQQGKLLPATIISWNNLKNIINQSSSHSPWIVAGINQTLTRVGSNRRLEVIGQEQKFCQKSQLLIQWLKISCEYL